MNIQERLKMVIKMNNLTASSFADRIGVQRSSLSHILSGRNKPSLDFIEKTLKSFPKVSGHWLITGKVAQTENEELVKKKPSKTLEKKEIEKVIVFYNDGTYDVTVPS